MIITPHGPVFSVAGDKLPQFRTWMHERRDQVLGIDCESNAADPHSPDYRLRLVQVADTTSAVVVLVETLSEDQRADLAHIIRNHRAFCAHYSIADITFLVRGLPNSVRIADADPHIVDTQTVLAVYEPRTVVTANPKENIHPAIRLPRGLKETSQRLIDDSLHEVNQKLLARFRALAPVGSRTGQKLKEWGYANIPIDDPVYIEYAGLDPLMTVKLFNLMREDLKRRGQWERVLSEFPIQWMLDQASIAGLAVDGDYAKWLYNEYSNHINKMENGLAHYSIPPSGMGPNVGAAFQSLGIEPVRRRRETGAASWDKDALLTLAGTDLEGQPLPIGAPPVTGQYNQDADQAAADLARALFTVRRAGKYRKVFVEPMVRTTEEFDGRMHCWMRAIGTVTSRMSAQATATSGPLHQMPKRSTTYIRAAVCASPGHVIVSADFAQGEPFTMAMLSGDKVFLADLMEGDINSVIASMVYGSAYIKGEGKVAGTVSYSMRQRAKFAFLAWCYGCAAKKLAGLLQIAENKGQEIIDRWRSRYRGVAKWQDALNVRREVVLPSGWVVPLWDRVGVTDDGRLFYRPRPSRNGCNYATQGTQADLLRVAMRRLLAEGWSPYFRFALHDELLLEVPESKAELARDALERAMTIEYNGVTLRCEATIEGKTWLPQPTHWRDESVDDD